MEVLDRGPGWFHEKKHTAGNRNINNNNNNIAHRVDDTFSRYCCLALWLSPKYSKPVTANSNSSTPSFRKFFRGTK